MHTQEREDVTDDSKGKGVAIGRGGWFRREGPDPAISDNGPDTIIYSTSPEPGEIIVTKAKGGHQIMAVATALDSTSLRAIDPLVYCSSR